MKKRRLLKFIMLFGDICLMYLSLFLALAVRYNDFTFLPGPQTTDFIYQFSIIFVFWTVTLYILDFFEVPPWKKILDFIKNLVIFSFIAFSSAVIYFYFYKAAIINPKTILLLHILFFVLLFFGWRYLISFLLKSRKLKEKVVIIDLPAGAEEFFEKDLLSCSGYKLLAFFSLKNNLKKLNKYSDYAKRGVVSDVKELKMLVEKEKVAMIVFPENFNEKLMQEVFSNLPFNLNYVGFADFYESLTKKTPIDAVNEAWFLKNISRFEKRSEKAMKRTVDVVFSLPGILITTLLFPFIALAIKIDSEGPVFYTQERVGKDKKTFNLYKFRTMKEVKNKEKETWRKNNEKEVTRVGKFLRKTHIDEFPQFFHILKGDISFVGPRPEWVKLVREFEKEIPFYSLRFVVKPGVTGWAQINYPASTSVQEAKEKFKYDLYYIKNRSLLLDLSVILKTFKKLFS
jgi:exopolysaccharide biosynthesis polyprenyl glycosylphosphotransferase